MPSLRVSRNNNSGIYYVTLTVHHWYYIFDRHNRWDILADTLNYYTKQQKAHIHSYVFMLNHLHIIFSAEDAAGFIRDFKKYTTRELKKNIAKTEPNVLQLFLDEDKTFQLWQSTNMPLLIETDAFLEQKFHYIHENPVRKTYVARAEQWYWSSANPSSPVKLTPIF